METKDGLPGDFRFHQLRKQDQRFLPSQVAHLSGNYVGKMNAKHFFIKKSDKGFVHKLEAKMPGSPAPVPLFGVTCKK